MKLAILTPSRGRPDRLKTFHESVRSLTSENDLLNMYYYLDNDDSKLNEYNELNLSNVENTFFEIGEPISISKSWNIIAQQAIDDGADVLIMGNDDLVYKSQNWDILLKQEIAKFPDNIYCIWPDDGLAKGNWCAFPCISKEWYNCVGYFAPGVFHFGYNDTWVWDIGKKLNRAHYVETIKIEHRHFSRNPHLNDNTYKRNREGPKGNLFHKDAKIWHETEQQRIDDAEKLRELCQNENSNL